MQRQRVVFVTFSLMLCACSQPSGPVEQGTSPTYIGGIGSQRTYLITEKWFIPFTDSPFVQVPDSLVDRVMLSDSLRRRGVVAMTEQVEVVTELDTSYYSSWHLPLPRRLYRMTEARGPFYNLYDEVASLSAHRPYMSSTLIAQDIWYEDERQLQKVTMPSDWAVMPPLSWLKKPLLENAVWVRSQVIDPASGEIRQQESVRVLGEARAITEASAFQAIRLQILEGAGPSEEPQQEFEYYVPNIGLVLYEADRYLCRTTTGPGDGPPTTVCFRQVIRKELVSCDVVQ